MFKRADNRPDYLDTNPVIELGDEPPGRSENGFWKGLVGWRTRHGPATISWTTGKPHMVEQARLPDGSRDNIRYALDCGFRRYDEKQRRWIHGAICIGQNDIWFHDDVNQPQYSIEPITDEPNPAETLSHNPEFQAAMDDDGFARNAYRYLMHSEFLRGKETWKFEGQREAAWYVALIRQRGESYLDYYENLNAEMFTPDPTVLEQISAVVGETGWRIKGETDYQKDHRAQIVALTHILRSVRRYEAREATSPFDYIGSAARLFRSQIYSGPPFNRSMTDYEKYVRSVYKRPGKLKRLLRTRAGWKRKFRWVNDRELGGIWPPTRVLNARIERLRETGRVTEQEQQKLNARVSHVRTI